MAILIFVVFPSFSLDFRRFLGPFKALVSYLGVLMAVARLYFLSKPYIHILYCMKTKFALCALCARCACSVCVFVVRSLCAFIVRFCCACCALCVKVLRTPTAHNEYAQRAHNTFTQSAQHVQQKRTMNAHNERTIKKHTEYAQRAHNAHNANFI